MPKLVERTIVLAKEETTFDTDASPDPSTDFIAVSDVNVNPNITFIDSAAQDGSLSPREGRAGQRFVEVTFTYEIQPNPTDVTAPPITALLKAAGFSAVTSDSPPSVTFTPVSTGFSSATLYVYWDGLLWKITGARGNPEFVFKVGDIAKVNFTFRGTYHAPEDATFPSSWTDNGAVPFVCMGGSLSYGGSDLPCIDTLSINMNNDIQIRPCLTSDSGVAGAVITNRDPQGTMDPDMTAVSENDWFSIMDAPTLNNLVYTLSNGTQSLTVTIPKLQVRTPAPQTRNNYRTWQISFSCVRDSGDDEGQLKFA